MTTIGTLIVDDDFMVANVHKGFTERVEGFSVLAVRHSGREALEAAVQLRPDLLILDIYLPDIDGLEVLRELRRLQLPVDVIMVTAAKDAAAFQQALQGGAVYYIIKPFDFAHYDRTLQNYRRFWLKRRATATLEQRDVDQLYGARTTPADDDLPKGLDRPTLELVVSYLAGQNEPVSARQVAAGVGVSRSTASRYLRYLEQRNQATLDLRYGSAGRPEHRYTLVG